MGSRAVHRTPGHGHAPLATLREAEPPAPSTRLGVGVLVDGPRIARWQLMCLSEIEGASFCDLTVVVPKAPRDAPAKSARHLLYHAYERADRRRFATDDGLLAPVGLVEGLRGTTARRIDVELHPDGRWSAREITKISSEALDVLVCLGDPPSRSELARCARHGLWWLSVGGAHARRDEAPLFWETFSADELSVTTLWALNGRDGGRAIYRSYTRIDPVTVHRNRLVSYRRAAQLPLRCLRDLHRGDGSSIAPASAAVEQPLDRRTKPTNLQTARFLGRLGGRVLRNRLRERFFEEQWYLAHRRREQAATTAGEAAFMTITPPPGRYYADPFLIERAGRRFLFFEEYVYATQRGMISYVEIDDEGRSSAPQVVLQRDHHLSYPFLYSEADTVYMVPESGERGAIELYRASRFPDQWEPAGVLLEGIEALDPTLLRHQGMYWLFAAVADGIWADELYLFCSDSLLGEWRPHPMNPVVSDVRRARPAGRIFARGGQLIRPAQDSSAAYGRRIVLNRIERLDETGYSEVPIGLIEPAGPTPSLRTHGYDADGLHEAVDGFRLRPRISLRGHRRDEGEQRFRFELDA